MLATLVGIKKIDYLKDRGKDTEKRVLGLELQLVREPSRREKGEVSGRMVQSIYIAGKDDIYKTVNFAEMLGKELELDFEVDGKYQYLVAVELAEA